MGGQTRFWGSGHTFSSLTVSPSAFSLVSAANLARFVLISVGGNSAKESQLKSMKKGIKYIEERITHLAADPVDHVKVLVFDLFWFKD